MKKFSFSVKDTFFVVIVLVITTLLSIIMSSYLSLNDYNVIALNIFAIILVTVKTDGYIYGIASAAYFAFFSNYFFTYSYHTFNFEPKGFLVTFSIMLLIAVLTSTLMSRMRKNAYNTYISDKKVQELANVNNKIRMESEQEVLRGNLLRAISHDIRTPLTAILGSASALLDMDKVDKASINEFASNIIKDSNWLIHMVENLLTITKIGDGAKVLNKTEELVEEVVSEACARIKNSYPEAKLSITVPDEMLVIPMDFMLIEQVLINLIENSIKYAGDNGNVYITVGKNERSVYFEIKDHGVGLNSKRLEHIFHQYTYDKDEVDSKQGMGIGLTICYSIIEAHNGEITAQNAVEGGAVFTFYLPIDL